MIYHVSPLYFQQVYEAHKGFQNSEMSLRLRPGNKQTFCVALNHHSSCPEPAWMRSVRFEKRFTAVYTHTPDCYFTRTIKNQIP